MIWTVVLLWLCCAAALVWLFAAHRWGFINTGANPGGTYRRRTPEPPMLRLIRGDGGGCGVYDWSHEEPA